MDFLLNMSPIFDAENNLQGLCTLHSYRERPVQTIKKALDGRAVLNQMGENSSSLTRATAFVLCDRT